MLNMPEDCLNLEAHDTTNARKKYHPVECITKQQSVQIDTVARIWNVPITYTVFYTSSCVLNYTYVHNQL